MTRWNILTLPRFSSFKDSPERGGVGFGQQIFCKKWKEWRRESERARGRERERWRVEMEMEMEMALNPKGPSCPLQELGRICAF